MFSTFGKEYYSGLELKIFYNDKELFLPETNNIDRFRLIFIEKGAGILKVDNNRILFNSPCVFCVSEKEQVFLEQSSDITAKTLYFHPNAVNSSLNFSNIRENLAGMTTTMINDCTCISAFYIRTEAYYGHMNIGIITAKRISFLLEELNRELTLQRDGFWPCRGRSFFLELLFCIQRVYFQKDDIDNSLLNSKSDDIDGVLLYLHSNYDKKITIDSLTKKFNINRTTLNKKFNNTTNMSVMSYLINYRVKIAAMILRETELPVSEIIERVGFLDYTHFSRLFKKYMKCSPTDYRQNYSGY